MAWSRGEAGAFEELVPRVTDELRLMAHRFFQQEGAGHLLQPTALVNEVYLHLVDRERVSWHNRAQFFGYAAKVMRRILVDHARKRLAEKRGGGGVVLSLEEIGEPAEKRSWDLIALDDALEGLAAVDARQSRIVELHYFGGLGGEEIGAVLKISRRTVQRELRTARLWLSRAMRSG